MLAGGRNKEEEGGRYSRVGTPLLVTPLRQQLLPLSAPVPVRVVVTNSIKAAHHKV